MGRVELLVKELGQTYSERLGIDLESREPGEIFKWFLASILFAARITETIAMNTYRQLERDGLLSPEGILRAGWDRLVASLDEGGYVRYDFRTADMLLGVASKLGKDYGGSLVNLYEGAADPADLERRLKEFKGVGDVTVEIFLRELRDVWGMARPLPGWFAMAAARNLGFTTAGGRGADERARALAELRAVWDRDKVPGRRFSHFETALVRLGKDFCRKGRCARCFMAEYCAARPRPSGHGT